MDDMYAIEGLIQNYPQLEGNKGQVLAAFAMLERRSFCCAGMAEVRQTVNILPAS